MHAQRTVPGDRSPGQQAGAAWSTVLRFPIVVGPLQQHPAPASGGASPHPTTKLLPAAQLTRAVCQQAGAGVAQQRQQRCFELGINLQLLWAA